MYENGGAPNKCSGEHRWLHLCFFVGPSGSGNDKGNKIVVTKICVLRNSITWRTHAYEYAGDCSLIRYVQQLTRHFPAVFLFRVSHPVLVALLAVCLVPIALSTLDRLHHRARTTLLKDCSHGCGDVHGFADGASNGGGRAMRGLVLALRRLTRVIFRLLWCSAASPPLIVLSRSA